MERKETSLVHSALMAWGNPARQGRAPAVLGAATAGDVTASVVIGVLSTGRQRVGRDMVEGVRAVFDRRAGELHEDVFQRCAHRCELVHGELLIGRQLADVGGGQTGGDNGAVVLDRGPGSGP